MNRLTKTLALLVSIIATAAGNITTAQAQDANQNYSNLRTIHRDQPTNDLENPFVEIYRDTTEYEVRGKSEVRDSVLDPMHVVTNRFGNNWFVFATGGAHTFQGDYSSTSKFNGTISPDWSVGIGKWFTPGLALKLEFIRSESRGYTQYLTGHYGYGPIQLNNKGIPFRDMRTGWWDISGAVVLNFTRLFMGYEGMHNTKRMNQIMGTFGFGGVHHLGFEHRYGSDNEWSGHVEFQYSRFFTAAKKFSLDFKIRGIFYQTNFDLEYGLYDDASNKWDSNVGADIGFTYYLDKSRNNGWKGSVTQLYRRDYRERDVLVYRERTLPIDSIKRENKLQVLTFYVFYPNNYSGRNDAPIIPESSVNAIDYLIGGIFTQKRYLNTPAISDMLNAGIRTTNQAYEDIPTENCSAELDIDCVQRGYEMSTTIPMSLSMRLGEMNAFKNQAGYYYAPIWDGLHEWHYRIDDATLRQQLLNSSNYYEQETHGLNSHAGLDIIRERLMTEGGDHLVSFADVYAAINGYNGYITDYADEKTVDYIRQVFDNGIVTVIEAHGCATSQDNFTGQNARQVGLDRNNSLAECRANTVSKWLKTDRSFNDSKEITYIDDSFAINPVPDPSTRGLAAKLNRCVKVRIQVIY